MIDWDRIDTLRSEIGLVDFCDVVGLFLEEAEEVIIRLQAAPDPSRYEADLHFLRGGALNFGFRDFAALCGGGEKYAADGHPDAVNIDEVARSYTTSKRAFVTRIAEICAEAQAKTTAAA